MKDDKALLFGAWLAAEPFSALCFAGAVGCWKAVLLSWPAVFWILKAYFVILCAPAKLATFVANRYELAAERKRAEEADLLERKRIESLPKPPSREERLREMEAQYLSEVERVKGMGLDPLNELALTAQLTEEHLARRAAVVG